MAKTTFESFNNTVKKSVKITLCPKDRYGNLLGPGKAKDFTLTFLPGTAIAKGGLKDKGDGFYDVLLEHDPSFGFDPGVVLRQPEREPVLITQSQDDWEEKSTRLWMAWLLLFVIFIVTLVTRLPL